jgi:hypothetical protein
MPADVESGGLNERPFSPAMPETGVRSNLIRGNTEPYFIDAADLQDSGRKLAIARSLTFDSMLIYALL